MSYNYTHLFREYLYSQKFEGPLKSSLEYILLNEGHWIRPQLVLAWCEYCGGNPNDALPLALAIECIHTMSLVHDDLPCMDNAFERRNKKCLHLYYDESTAVLTGDFLLNKAFELVIKANLSTHTKNMVILILTEINTALCNGQFMDLHEDFNANNILQIHYLKTAKLIEGSCALGAIAANNFSMVEEAQTFGSNLGMLYQILDDISDEDGLTIIYNASDVNQLKIFYYNNCMNLIYKLNNNGYLYLQKLINSLKI